MTDETDSISDFEDTSTPIRDINSLAQLLAGDAYDVWISTGGRKTFSKKDFMTHGRIPPIIAEVARGVLLDLIDSFKKAEKRMST